MINHLRYTYALATVVSKNDCPFELRLMLNSLLHQENSLDEYCFLINGPVEQASIKLIEEFTRRHSGKTSMHLFDTQQDFSTCLNRIILETSCDVIVRQDPDDIAMPNRFTEIIRTFNKGAVDVFFSNSVFREGNNLWIDKRLMHLSIDEALGKIGLYNPFIHSSAAFKRDSVLKTGGYRMFKFVEDYDLWLRFLHNNLTFEFNNKFLVIYNFSGVLKRRSNLKILNSEFQLLASVNAYRRSNLFKIVVFTALRLIYLLSPPFFKRLVVIFYRLRIEDQTLYSNLLQTVRKGPVNVLGNL